MQAHARTGSTSDLAALDKKSGGKLASMVKSASGGNLAGAAAGEAVVVAVSGGAVGGATNGTAAGGKGAGLQLVDLEAPWWTAGARAAGAALQAPLHHLPRHLLLRALSQGGFPHSSTPAAPPTWPRVLVSLRAWAHAALPRSTHLPCPRNDTAHLTLLACLVPLPPPLALTTITPPPAMHNSPPPPTPPPQGAVKDEAQSTSEGPHADRLVLLRNISGSFRPGVLTALMGASGAG